MPIPVILSAVLAKLAESGLNTIAGAIEAKGKEAVENIIGVKIPDKAEQLTPELLQQLKIKEMEHEEKLLEIAIRRQEIENADRQSARDREAKVVTADNVPLLNKIIMPLLALGVLGLSFVLFFVLFLSNTPIDASRKDILIYTLGFLSAMDLQILNYYFGTSEGSTRAAQLFRDMIGRQAKA